MKVPKREELKKKKVVELRAELSKLRLPQGGVKDDLVTRLIVYYQKLSDEEAQKNKADDAPGEGGGQNEVKTGEAIEEAMETGTEESTVTDPVDAPPAEGMEVVEDKQMKQKESHDQAPPSGLEEKQPSPVSEQPPPASVTPTAVSEQVSAPVPSISTSSSEKPPAAQHPITVQPPADQLATISKQAPVTEPSLGSQTTSDYYSAADSPKEQPKEPQAEQAAGEEKGKKKKKKKRRRRRHDQAPPTPTADVSTKENEVEIEYVQEDILEPDDPNYHQFHKIFEAFKLAEIPDMTPKTDSVSELVAKAAEASKRLAQARHHVPEEDDEEEEKEPVTMTKKKLRKLNRLTVAQLKQLVDRPDVVEMHDVTALDPKLLIHLKSTRNTVPVPRHWCFKRKYLQGKRGIEKPPFNLPDFIKATGVMEMRQALEEKEDAKTLKQKTRERVRPKMGKLTIDYQKLHDAFFKWQTKPKMSLHGELYYEGKEFETRLRQKKPGDLSDELRRSLGMPIGMGKHKFPPPWLVAMQRYGPPPSYPHLKIPGLNAPIPEGCSFGYFVGGWGKPPVDEGGRPLYGDVFGMDSQEGGGVTNDDDEGLDRTPWGELESEEEDSEEESEEEEEGSPKPEDIQAGLVTPMEGLVTPSGLTSIPAGLETPEMIQLRKKKIEEAMEQGGETPSLYTVLPEKTAAVGGAMMGSSHVYDVGSGVPGAIRKGTGSGMEGIEVALDPSELDLDTATMTARYEEQMKEKNVLQKEDLSDMVAEHAAKQKKRKRTAADSGGKASKKLKEFKF